MTVPQTEPKFTRKRGPLLLSAATLATARNWKEDGDRSREFTNDINALIEFSKIAERGKLHNIFFVDHLSWFDSYGGFQTAAKNGVNASRIDPATAVVALANATKDLGFVITFSTVSEHPYHFHRRLASLDHLTNGRVAWNIVASYLPSVGKNLLNGEPLPEHDERYVKTSEYLDVVYDLLLSSWRDDALVYDKVNGIFADPEALRTIDHVGKYYKVEGPAISEPTPQRFPLIVQAGNSKKGVDFAAENAEVIFVSLGSSHKIAEVRKLAKEKYNRDPYSIKFIAGFPTFIGRTHEEAQAKVDAHDRSSSLEATLVYFSSVSGFDLSGYDWDEPINLDEESNGVRSTVDLLVKKGEVTTKRKIAQKWATENRFVGTPVEIADQIEEILANHDIDGFNLGLNTFPESITDLVDLLIPELQKRGLAQTEYPVKDGTFRENVYGLKGQSFVPADHPAFNLRWRKGVSKEQFEKELKIYKELRQTRRDASE